MIYNGNKEYKIKFYQNLKSGRSPALEFIESLPNKHQAKVLKYLEFLKQHGGVLDEPYSRHIQGKIRELRVDFARNNYRIFYFVMINRVIVVLDGFIKKTNQTPVSQINKAKVYYKGVLMNAKHYA
ncbi:MAG: type II toxin-antitoxin system RelE/ParE family toxin [Patescibacteria group bacterium]